MLALLLVCERKRFFAFKSQHTRPVQLISLVYIWIWFRPHKRISQRCCFCFFFSTLPSLGFWQFTRRACIKTNKLLIEISARSCFDETRWRRSEKNHIRYFVFLSQVATKPSRWAKNLNSWCLIHCPWFIAWMVATVMAAKRHAGWPGNISLFGARDHNLLFFPLSLSLSLLTLSVLNFGEH